MTHDDFLSSDYSNDVCKDVVWCLFYHIISIVYWLLHYLFVKLIPSTEDCKEKYGGICGTLDPVPYTISMYELK